MKTLVFYRWMFVRWISTNLVLSLFISTGLSFASRIGFFNYSLDVVLVTALAGGFAGSTIFSLLFRFKKKELEGDKDIDAFIFDLLASGFMLAAKNDKFSVYFPIGTVNSIILPVVIEKKGDKYIIHSAGGYRP